MAIMRKLLVNARKQKEAMSASSSPPRYTRLSDDDHREWEGPVRKGYIPVLVGAEEGARERFLIPTHLMSHPVIVSLLESSADEFGYRQEGVIQIPADPECFRETVRSLQSSI